MASAVLASQNEPYWGERKVYMRKYTNTNAATINKNAAPFANLDLNPNPYPNPIPNPIHKPSKQVQFHNPPSNLHFRQRGPSPARRTTLPDRKLISVDEKARGSPQGGYVTFNVSSYTRWELKELKRRLVYELEQVRALKTRLETLTSKSRPVHPISQYSTTHSPPQPPPSVQLNSLASNPSNPKHQSCTPKSYQTKRKGPSHGPGSKRTNPFSDHLNQKPHAFDSLGEKIINSMMKKCRQILGQLMKQKYAWVFNKPVDEAALGLIDYHQIIKKPMDLGTVKSNLDGHVYNSPMDFAADVRLTFDNAMAYNPKEHDVHGMAQQLLMKFNEMFDSACRKFEEEQLRIYGRIQILVEQVPQLSVEPALLLPPPLLVKEAVGAQKVVMVEQPMVVVKQQGRVGKLPKPKARDPDKRGMSFEEKEKLGSELAELPDEKTLQLVQIVKKRNVNLAQDGDEIELDIGTMDTETLWELDRFVNNYKKTVSKIRRQGLIHSQPTPAQIEMKTNQSPVSEMVDAGNKVAEEDVDIGEEIPIGNYPPVEIEKDVNACGSGRSSSYGSSSSGSDSSSSIGSDSGSSSGSDSVADADGVQSPNMEEKEDPLT